jgi:hypothetical protein
MFSDFLSFSQAKPGILLLCDEQKADLLIQFTFKLWNADSDGSEEAAQSSYCTAIPRDGMSVASRNCLPLLLLGSHRQLRDASGPIPAFASVCSTIESKCRNHKDH